MPGRLRYRLIRYQGGRIVLKAILSKIDKDWKNIWVNAWSSRILWFQVVGGAGLTVAPIYFDAGFMPLWFYVLVMSAMNLLTSAALISRIVTQKKVTA